MGLVDRTLTMTLAALASIATVACSPNEGTPPPAATTSERPVEPRPSPIAQSPSGEGVQGTDGAELIYVPDNSVSSTSLDGLDDGFWTVSGSDSAQDKLQRVNALGPTFFIGQEDGCTLLHLNVDSFARNGEPVFSVSKRPAPEMRCTMRARDPQSGMLFEAERIGPDRLRLVSEDEQVILESHTIEITPTAALPKRDYGINSNPFTTRTEGGGEHFFLNVWGRWQFADIPDPDPERDGAAFRYSWKAYMNFNPEREMWGDDGRIYFRRIYAFDPEAKTVTFTLDRSRCRGACYDHASGFGDDRREEPTQYLGTYSYEEVVDEPIADADGDGYPDYELVLRQGDTVIRLESYVAPEKLPDLPDDQRLCQVRTADSTDFVDGSPQFREGDDGWQLTGPASAFLFDHHDGGEDQYIEFLGNAPVRFDTPELSQIIRRVVPHPTVLVLTPRGAYCRTNAGREYGRVWVRPSVLEPTDGAPGYADVVPTDFSSDTECLTATATGRERERVLLVFEDWSQVGQDDFGTYFMVDGEKRRVGDSPRMQLGRFLSPDERSQLERVHYTCRLRPVFARPASRP